MRWPAPLPLCPQPSASLRSSPLSMLICELGEHRAASHLLNLFQKHPQRPLPPAPLVPQRLEDRSGPLYLLRSVPQVLLQLIPVCERALVLEAEVVEVGLYGAEGLPLPVEPRALLNHLILCPLQGFCLGDDDLLCVVVQVDCQHPAAKAGGGL